MEQRFFDFVDILIKNLQELLTHILHLVENYFAIFDFVVLSEVFVLNFVLLIIVVGSFKLDEIVGGIRFRVNLVKLLQQFVRIIFRNFDDIFFLIILLLKQVFFFLQNLVKLVVSLQIFKDYVFPKIYRLIVLLLLLLGLLFILKLNVSQRRVHNYVEKVL